MLTDYATTALTTLLVTLDPVALAPIFAGLTRAMQPSQRRQVAWRASLIAFGVLAFFALGGEALLRLRGRPARLPHCGWYPFVLDRLRDGVRAPQ